MLNSRLNERSLDNPFDSPTRNTEAPAKTTKARAKGPVKKQGPVGKKSRVTMAGLLEALAGTDSVSSESSTSESVAVESLTKRWSELPKGATSSGFVQGLQNTLESLKRKDSEREPSAAFASQMPECMKILEEEIEMARYVDIYRKALRKA